MNQSTNLASLSRLCGAFVFAMVAGFTATAPAAEKEFDGTSLAPAQVPALREKIRRNFFIPAPLPELRAETHRRFAPMPGVKAEAVTYASQFGLRVPAILYLPDPLPSGKLPGFIVVNGHGGDKYSWYAFYTGLLYAKAGAAVLTFDPMGEGERNRQHKSGTRAHDTIKGDAELGRRVGGLLMTDVMQAVSYLAARPEVDSKRIGAGGYSLGSFILSITGAIEPRLKACVLVGGGNLDAPGEYWDKSKPMCQAYPYQSLNFLGDRPAVIYALHAARGPVLLWNGLADSVVNMPNTPPPFFDDLRARAARLRGATNGLFEAGFERGISHRPFFVTRPVALWLERQLDFPHWTAASIAKLPEIKISEWAKAHDVAMDKLYATEQREGGAPALDVGAPGLSRDDLSVFTMEEWERRKATLIQESWLEAARKVP
ncbi:MAG: acetylxylan esterase [Verrucomicrobia bacterium]|nr:acetylxylan esterase [Verrucomicrobiota bacterium]